MVNKALLGGVVGFLLGGLVVSTVAVTLEKDNTSNNNQTSTSSTVGHNKEVTEKLRGLQGDEFDQAFIEEMISHHQGAIDKAQLTSTNAKHDEVKKLGQDIISAQSSEIEMMKMWQSDWGYQSSVDEAHDM